MRFLLITLFLSFLPSLDLSLERPESKVIQCVSSSHALASGQGSTCIWYQSGAAGAPQAFFTNLLDLGPLYPASYRWGDACYICSAIARYSLLHRWAVPSAPPFDRRRRLATVRPRPPALPAVRAGCRSHATGAPRGSGDACPTPLKNG